MKIVAEPNFPKSETRGATSGSLSTKVVLIRRTGMVIFPHPRSIFGYATNMLVLFAVLALAILPEEAVVIRSLLIVFLFLVAMAFLDGI